MPISKRILVLLVPIVAILVGNVHRMVFRKPLYEGVLNHQIQAYGKIEINRNFTLDNRGNIEQNSTYKS